MRKKERKILCKTCLNKLRKIEAMEMKKYRKNKKVVAGSAIESKSK